MASVNEGSENSTESCFSNEVEKLFDNERKFRKDDSTVKVGVETEYFLVEERQHLQDLEKRNEILDSLDFCKQELAADSIEIATDALALSSFKQLEQEISEKEKKLREEALDRNLFLLRSGTNPFRELEKLELSQKPSLKKINRYFRNDETVKLGDKNEIDVGDARAASLISALHTNIEASSFEDAVSKANYIYMISPYISALSGNARFLDGRDTGLSDLRMILWEKSHSTDEIDIGRLDSYFDSMRDYLERVEAWPEVIEYEESILEKNIAHFWKDSRIKFSENDLIVESRIASTQPSVREDVAVHAFCIGRLLYAIDSSEQLLDIEKVNHNREQAMRHGLEGEFYSPEGVLEESENMLLKEIEKASEGLEIYGIDSENYMEILKERVEKGELPSDRLANRFQRETKNAGNRKALFNALGIKQ